MSDLRVQPAEPAQRDVKMRASGKVYHAGEEQEEDVGCSTCSTEHQTATRSRFSFPANEFRTPT